MTEDEYWTALQETGWLTSVPDHQRDELRQAIAGVGPEGRYRCLAMGGFDSECIEDEDSYVLVLSAYRDASGGRFAPEQVDCTIDHAKETAQVSFHLGGRTFSSSVPFEGDYFEEGVHDLVNRSLAETGTAERFSMLPSSDQTIQLVFVPAVVFERALERGVIPREQKPPVFDFDSDELEAQLEIAVRSDDPDKAVAAMHEVNRMLHMSMTPEHLEEIAENARRRQKKE